MYGWLWRHLPGPLPVRLLLAAALAAAALVLCATVVFPAVAGHLAEQQVVGAGPRRV